MKYADDENTFIQISKEFKKLERYDDAIKSLENSQNIFGSSPELLREITLVRQAKLLYEKNDTNIVISGLELNSQSSEFTSDILEGKIYFSSDRYNNKKDQYGWTGRYFFDIYSSYFNGQSNIETFTDKINSDFNDSSITFNKTGDKCYFVRCGEENKEISYCKLYFSEKIDGEWTEGEPLEFQHDGINYVSPRISGDILYFSSDDPAGYGGYDIYLSKKNSDGSWSKPYHLPSKINTPGNENYLTIYQDTFYFSSDYLSGLGGYDIYYFTIDSSGNFSSPQHVDYPLNSGGDDFYLLKINDNEGFISSSRMSGQGYDDIYRFKINRFEPSKNDSIEKPDIDDKNNEIYIALYTFENVYSTSVDPNSKIIGKKPVPHAIVKFGKEIIGETDDYGNLTVKLDFDTIYNIVIGKKDYLSVSNEFSTVQIVRNGEKQIVNHKVKLDKIYLNQEVVLKNIYYDYDQWELRDDSKPTLNFLYNLLKNNPQYKVKIGSHTDCRGDNDYNIDLSQKRAQSVVDFLVQKGIDVNRLEAKGYGEENLKINCKCEDCTEFEHQENRRTTFELAGG